MRNGRGGSGDTLTLMGDDDAARGVNDEGERG
jgi:hypothetical protein